MSRIVTNTSALTVYKDYQANNIALSGSLEKLSSGLAINRASDDPAGLAISEDMRSQIAGTNEAVNVIANANNYINTADGYLQTVNDMLGRMEELAVEYNDGTQSAGAQSDINNEFTSLVSELSNMDSQALFNGSQIFQDITTGLQFQVGANKGDTFDLSNINTVESMTSSSKLVLSGGAEAAITAIQAATEAVSTTRATLGAEQSQLNYKSTALQNYSVNISASESDIRNVDVAQESTTYAKEQILVQSSTAMLAQANAVPQNVLTLLK